MKRYFVWIDILRMVLALLVVCIHVQCALTPHFSWILPIAVPGFFVISGFLMWKKTDQSYTRALKKIGMTTIVSILLYLPIYVFLFQDRDWKSVETWIHMMVFNEPFESEHLWYLLAYFYVLIIFRFVGRHVQSHTCFLLGLVLLLLGVNLCLRYAELEGYWWRNWLLTGVPYFSLGLVLRTLYERYQMKFLEVDVEQHPWLARVGSWGSRYSLDIYILHPLVLILSGYTLCGLFVFRAAMWWLGPLVIFAMTWFVSITKHYLLNLFKSR